VTVGTLSRSHKGVAEGGAGETRRAAVTGLAGVGTGEVVGGGARLGPRIDTIVARGATGGDARMREGAGAADVTGATGSAGYDRPVAAWQCATGSRNPGRGPMAAVAGCRGRNMVGRLAGGADTVAGGTGARPDLGMAETCTFPGRGRAMALGATQRGRHMVGGLGGIAKSTALGVTLLALFGRAFEDTAHMTGLTFLLCVGAGKREAGALMVEVALTLFRSRHRRDNHEQGQ